MQWFNVISSFVAYLSGFMFVCAYRLTKTWRFREDPVKVRFSCWGHAFKDYNKRLEPVTFYDVQNGECIKSVEKYTEEEAHELFPEGTFVTVYRTPNSRHKVVATPEYLIPLVALEWATAVLLFVLAVTIRVVADMQ